jgi:hypothetical protein
MTSQILQNSYEVYRQTHETNPQFFLGESIVPYVFEIKNIIKNSNIKTCIDYGCGKAQAWTVYNLQRLFVLEGVTRYDPGVVKYSKKPQIPADLVLCIDVLEHVPEECVDEVLEEICSLSKKVIFLNISTRTATKILTDGSNAHTTVKPQEWWQAKIDKLDHYIITHYS